MRIRDADMLTLFALVIINAPVMSEDSQGGKSKAKLEHKSKSAYCDIITKPYFLIVVAKYASHYSVVPIHTRKSPLLHVAWLREQRPGYFSEPCPTA